MSQSPISLATAKHASSYDKAWNALNRLLRSGRSFSGHERNCCFLNIGQPRFADVSATVGLDQIDDGRAVALSDWDFDGDLDLWVTNHSAPRVRFLRNDVADGHHFLAVRLQGETCNRDAVGARLELYLPGGRRRIKTLHAGDGFLSQSTKWIHFGLGTDHRIDHLVIHWPGGKAESFRDITSDHHYDVVQGTGHATEWKPPAGAPQLSPATADAPPATNRARVVLLRPPVLPELTYVDLKGREVAIRGGNGKPLLLNLWATWCQPCLSEMQQWIDQQHSLRDAGLQIVAICVDQTDADLPSHLREISDVVDRLRFPFAVGVPHRDLVATMDALQWTYITLQSAMPVPSSFLIDGAGRVVAIYKGPVPHRQLLDDVRRLMNADHKVTLEAAMPFTGRWMDRPVPLEPRRIAMTLFDRGKYDAAEQYLRQLISAYRNNVASANTNVKTDSARPRPEELADLYKFLGAMLSHRQRYGEAIDALSNYLDLVPEDRRGRLEIARALVRANRLEAAAEQFELVLQGDPKDGSAWSELAAVRMRQGETEKAIDAYRQSLRHNPSPQVHFQLANAQLEAGDTQAAVRQFRAALRMRPGWIPAANNLAWVLATSPNPNIRNGPEAVQLAEKACQDTAHRIPSLLGTLAAAYAEVGRFDEAVATADQAAELALKSGKMDLAEQLKQRLRTYKSRRPYRS